MGLNLSIRRIIFSALEKYDGIETRPLRASEIKQIAGRAGRFGTDYSEGEVTCVKDDDMSSLHLLMKQADAPVSRAGLFPSADQLALLAILIDYRIHSKVLELFILQDSADGWDVSDETIEHQAEFQVDQRFDVELIRSKHGSLTSFVKKFDQFLLSNVNLDSRCKSSARRVFKQRKARYKRTMGNRNDSAEKELGPSTFYDPLSPLANLFDQFRRLSSMSPDYFLCDLDERTLLADSIDDMNLTFADQYLFCMAPVEADDAMIMQEFTRYAAVYSTGGNVKLSSSLVSMTMRESADYIKTPAQVFVS